MQKTNFIEPISKKLAINFVSESANFSQATVRDSEPQASACKMFVPDHDAVPDKHKSSKLVWQLQTRFVYIL